jgi:hypothetical protein
MYAIIILIAVATVSIITNFFVIKSNVSKSLKIKEKNKTIKELYEEKAKIGDAINTFEKINRSSDAKKESISGPNNTDNFNNSIDILSDSRTKRTKKDT